MFNMFKTENRHKIKFLMFYLMSYGVSYFGIIHSVETEVSCNRQVLFIAFFIYNGIVDYWLFTCPGRESWIFVI